MEDSLIDTVIFDMGGVIFENGTREAINKLVSVYNVKEDIAEDIYNSALSWDLRAGLLSSDNYWEVVRKKYSNHDFCGAVNLKELWYEQFVPLPGMLELIHGLKGKVRVGVLSGNIEDRVRYIFQRYGLEKFFDFEAYSFTYNLHKNDPNLYLSVIKKFNIAPKDALFIDDNQDCIDAAKLCGLQVHLFNGVQHLQKELQVYGI